jgi:hypothetical protein
MIRSTKVLFCSEMHGIGDVTFPPLDELTVDSFIAPPSTRQLRREATIAGWKCIRGVDYCEGCMAAKEDAR